ncbi:MAG: CopG family transcriptional regulator [Candidatus Kapabacteria bacterium]|nr:CopG family transcriptional regulator [Candidatus Kapabacteria bacterium]
MRTKRTFTSTISTELISLLDDYSKKLNMPKNHLISIAIGKYMNELKKQDYIQSFQKAKDDSEMKTLSEEGYEDFLEIINK